MKNIIIVCIASLFSSIGYAQNLYTDSLLSQYIQLKDALIASKQGNASTEAGKLVVTLNATDVGALSSEQVNRFSKVKPALLKSANTIASAKDIEEQRNALAELSVNLWSLLKSEKNAGLVLYYDYCPMKRSYWISLNEPIKNPYYGSKMLTCGKISEKIN